MTRSQVFLGWPSRDKVQQDLPRPDLAAPCDVLIGPDQDQRRSIKLSKPRVAEHLSLKASQPERWLAGMRKLVRQARAGAGGGA